MFGSLAKGVGSSNDRAVKNLQPLISKINGFEDGLSGRMVFLRDMTGQLRDRLAKGDKDDLLAEAFALVEKRQNGHGQRHFDVR